MVDEYPQLNAELQYLGLGKERSIQQYEQYTGLNLRAHTQAHHCEQIYDWNTRSWLPSTATRKPPLARPIIGRGDDFVHD